MLWCLCVPLSAVFVLAHSHTVVLQIYSSKKRARLLAPGTNKPEEFAGRSRRDARSKWCTRGTRLFDPASDLWYYFNQRRSRAV